MLRPMEYGELFNEAFDLYKRNFALFFGIGAVVYIPYGLLSALATGSNLLSGLVGLGFIVPLVAAYGAIIKGLADRYLGRPTSIGEAWSYILRRIVPFFFTMVIAGLLVIGGFFLFCVPGIIAAFWIAFVVPVAVVEDRYYSAAIRRSRELAAGQWLRILVIGFLTWMIIWAVWLVIGSLVALLLGVQFWARGGAGAAEDVAVGSRMAFEVLNGLLQAALTPITSLLVVLLYFDVRVRKEGYDIELLAQEMGELPPSAGPSGAPA